MGVLLEVIGILVLSVLVFFGLVFIKQNFFDRNRRK
jgi:hypothetical protein